MTDNYSWRVRATDEHGMVGSWSSADTFLVTQVGTAPVCTLIPLVYIASYTPRTTWSYFDADGDLQTDYQVQLDSHSGFPSVEYDTGTVTSSACYYQHAALAAQLWYRRVRVRTASADWSGWASDTMTVAAPVAQTALWELYHTGGAAITQPVSGIVVERRLDNGPTSFKFTIDNFDGLEGGIADDADLTLKLRDSAGKLLSFRGYVLDKAVGDMLEVSCSDISERFERWKCQLSLTDVTLGEAIAAMIANPTGSAATSIVCHCEECPDPAVTDSIVRFSSWEGGGKTAGAWLGEFQTATNFRWYVEDISGVWHFYWYNPATVSSWAITVKDSIDFSAESSSQLRLLDGVSVARTRRNYANRIRFWGQWEPPGLPAGVSSYDQILTDDAAQWTAWSTTALANDAVTKVKGTNAIKFSRTFTGPCTLPTGAFDLGFRPWPVFLANVAAPMVYWDYYALVIQNQINLTLDGTRINYPYNGGISLVLRVFSGGKTGPTGGLNLANNPFSMIWSGRFAPVRWTLSDLSASNSLVPGAQNVDLTNITGIGISLYTGRGDVKDYVVAAGHEAVLSVTIDAMQVQGRTVKMAGGVPEQLTVETAAVTAGTEIPIELETADGGLPLNTAQALAACRLALASRTQVTVSNLALAGIRNVPPQVNVPVLLTKYGINPAVAYPPVSVVWKPGDSGDVTELVVGDWPADTRGAFENLAHKLTQLSAERQRGSYG